MLQWVRRNFIAGFFVTVPLVISVAALIWIFRVIDNLVGPIYDAWLPWPIPGLGFLTTALVVLLVGTIATNVIGKRVLQRAEYYLTLVPVFRTIYAPVKQLVVAFSPDNEYGFKRMALVEDPSHGYKLGFLTKEFTIDRGRGAETHAGGLRADQSPVSGRRDHRDAGQGAVSRDHRRAGTADLPDRRHGAAGAAAHPAQRGADSGAGTVGRAGAA